MFSTAPPPTGIHSLSLHDALPIFLAIAQGGDLVQCGFDAMQAVAQRLEQELALAGELHAGGAAREQGRAEDRKSTRLNSSHVEISYAVFCLKKKTNRNPPSP